MEGMISDVSLHPARQILIVIFGLQKNKRTGCLYIVTLHSTYTRALTFENLCQGSGGVYKGLVVQGAPFRLKFSSLRILDVDVAPGTRAHTLSHSAALSSRPPASAPAYIPTGMSARTRPTAPPASGCWSHPGALQQLSTVHTLGRSVEHLHCRAPTATLYSTYTRALIFQTFYSTYTRALTPNPKP